MRNLSSGQEGEESQRYLAGVCQKGGWGGCIFLFTQSFWLASGALFFQHIPFDTRETGCKSTTTTVERTPNLCPPSGGSVAPHKKRQQALLGK